MRLLAGEPGAREIREQLRSLRSAGRALRARPTHALYGPLGELLDAFGAERSAARDALAAALAANSGFSGAVLREGLRRGFSAWTAASLRELVELELRTGAQAATAAPPGRRTARELLGFETTATFLAGSIPMPTLLEVVAPLALRSPVLIKTSAGDRISAHRIAEVLAGIDRELGECVRVADFAGEDAACTQAACGAACVIATGSDESVAALRARVGSSQRFLAHGHRLSLEVLGAAALAPRELAGWAERIALDTSLWDQLGCLSPIAVYVVGADLAASARLASALARAFADAEALLPRGAVPASALARASFELAEAEMRAAGGSPVEVFRGSGASFAVVREADAALRPTPLYRFLRVHPVADADELLRALAPLGPQLACAGVAGFGEADAALAARLLALGASRVCRPGELQSPPLSWPRDGRPVLRSLAREVSSELRD